MSDTPTPSTMDDLIAKHERVVAERDKLNQELLICRNTVMVVAEERDAARAELAAFREANGHNAPCVMCNEPCNVLAGNPGLWPVRLGNDGWRHVACINKALAELAEAQKECFALAANQCHAPWNDEYGNHRCHIEDELAAERSQRIAANEIADQRAAELADLGKRYYTAVGELADKCRELAEGRAEIERLHAQSWQPGMPRCDFCDNGLNPDWAYCPYCSRVIDASKAAERAPPPEDAMEAATRIVGAYVDRVGAYDRDEVEFQLYESDLINEMARALTAAREAEREKYATVVEALKRIWPWFEGEHYHDHPDAVFVRNVLAALDGGQR